MNNAMPRRSPRAIDRPNATGDIGSGEEADASSVPAGSPPSSATARVSPAAATGDTRPAASRLAYVSPSSSYAWSLATHIAL